MNNMKSASTTEITKLKNDNNAILQCCRTKVAAMTRVTVAQDKLIGELKCKLQRQDATHNTILQCCMIELAAMKEVAVARDKLIGELKRKLQHQDTTHNTILQCCMTELVAMKEVTVAQDNLIKNRNLKMRLLRKCIQHARLSLNS